MKRVVAIQVAMKEEGLGFVKKANLIEVEMLCEELGFRQFVGNYGHNLQLRLFLQGTDTRYDAEQIGLEPAAVCAALYIKQYRPHLIINFGTAGAFLKSGIAMAETVLIKSPVKFHDRRVPLLGYFESQEGHHRVAQVEGLAKSLNLKTALLSSGSSLEMSSRDAEVLKDHSADLKEMEGAAIAWIAEEMNVPLLLLKAVTDFTDVHETIEKQFLKNLPQASENAQLATLNLLEFLDQNLEHES